MKFRPCIDLHDGMVKQIVGSSLKDRNGSPAENFVSRRDADYFAGLYREDGLEGGHVILLNPSFSPEYEKDLEQAKKAFQAYPGGMQLGGGVTAANAKRMLDLGASHVIVTSYVFHDGRVDQGRLLELNRAAGKDHLVLDLSCKKRDGSYYIVTDRWQKFTDQKLDVDLLARLEAFCNEFLIHGADVEGKKAGIDQELVTLLSGYDGLPVVYAGGVGTMEDLEKIRLLGKNRIDVTIGSALDLFGGGLPYREIVKRCGQCP